jgi:hypothetical protein
MKKLLHLLKEDQQLFVTYCAAGTICFLGTIKLIMSGLTRESILTQVLPALLYMTGSIGSKPLIKDKMFLQIAL